MEFTTLTNGSLGTTLTVPGSCVLAFGASVIEALKLPLHYPWLPPVTFSFASNHRGQGLSVTLASTAYRRRRSGISYGREGRFAQSDVGLAQESCTM